MKVTGAPRSIYFSSKTLSRAMKLKKQIRATSLSETIRKLIDEKYDKLNPPISQEQVKA